MKRGHIAASMVGLLLAGALIGVGVAVYRDNVHSSIDVPATVQVVVSSQDIPPGTKLDQLIDHNVFRYLAVPNEALVEGAITNIDQLRGETSHAFIYQGEQIPIGRITDPCPGYDPATPAPCL